MKLIKTTGLVAVAFGLVALVSAEAAAQTPTVTATASGNRVTIDITPVAGALGNTLVAATTPGGSDVVTINLPISITHIVVDAPSGTYYLRVRSFAGTIVSAFSPEVSVTAGGPVCTGTPAAPTVTPTVQGGGITLNWNAIQGASRYLVGWSRYSGGTELVDALAGTETSKYRWAGMLGTFYARVTVQTPCGTATSAETPFTISNLNLGGGPRTPDPPAGTLLPMPDYANAVVQDIGRRYAADLAAHSGPACKAQNMWLFKLLRELRTRDSRWGLNWKRGHPGSFSTDIITYNPTAGPDVTATHIYLSDVLSGECESNIPVFNWERVTSETWNVWNTENRSLCANRDCAAWTIQPFLDAGFTPDEAKELLATNPDTALFPPGKQ